MGSKKKKGAREVVLSGAVHLSGMVEGRARPVVCGASGFGADRGSLNQTRRAVGMSTIQVRGFVQAPTSLAFLQEGGRARIGREEPLASLSAGRKRCEGAEPRRQCRQGVAAIDIIVRGRLAREKYLSDNYSNILTAAIVGGRCQVNAGPRLSYSARRQFDLATCGRRDRNHHLEGGGTPLNRYCNQASK